MTTSRSSGLCLGLDPGRSGGAVLTLRGQAVAAAVWRPHQRQRRTVYAMTYVRPQGPPQGRQGLPGAWAIGQALRALLAPLVALHGGGLLLACEAAHAGRNAQTGLRLSRWGGALAGPLEPWAPHGVATWVEPSEWRKVLFRSKWWAQQAAEADAVISAKAAEKLGVRRMPKREAAKREAVRAIPGAVPGMEVLLHRLPDAGVEHALDAAGVCRWRWLREDT
jgi:hypothetical protein